MKIIQVKRLTYHRETREYEYGYAEPAEVHYQLLQYVVFLFGIKIFWWTYFKEVIPNWAYYQNACTGWTDWKSKNPQLIDYHTLNPIVFEL